VQQAFDTALNVADAFLIEHHQKYRHRFRRGYNGLGNVIRHLKSGRRVADQAKYCEIWQSVCEEVYISEAQKLKPLGPRPWWQRIFN